MDGVKTQKAGVKIIRFLDSEAPFISEVFANTEACSVPARPGQKTALSTCSLFSDGAVLPHLVRTGIFSHKTGGLSVRSLEKSKCHSYLQEGQKRGLRELQAGQSQLLPWKGDGATNPGNNFQIHECQESHEE